MLNVLVVQPTCDKLGHYGFFTNGLCHALGKLGHRVTLCTNRANAHEYIDGSLNFRLYEVEGGRFGFSEVETPEREKVAYYRAYYRCTYQVMRAALRLSASEQFDVAFVSDAEFLTTACLLRLYRKIAPPIVMQVRAANFSYADYRGGRLKKLYKWFQRAMFRSCLGREIRALSVNGRWHQQQLEVQLGLGLDCPAVVTGYGLRPWDRPFSPETARERLGIDYAGPLLLFFGTLRRDKGIETLFQALTRLKDLEFKLVVAGHPAEYSPAELNAMSRRAELHDRLLLRPAYVSEAEMPYYFYAAEALILPYNRSYRDGSGPLMEGASTFGRPVIASDIAELGRLVRCHRLGLLSTPGDAVELAQRIRQFLALPESKKSDMGRRAAALGRANTFETMAAKFTVLFNRVADGVTGT